MGESCSGQACPVCGTPTRGDDFCGVCQWQLCDVPVLGELTPEDVEAARAALAAAGHAWDTRAAVLAAGASERGGVGDRVGAVVRGGPPRPGERAPGDSRVSPEPFTQETLGKAAKECEAALDDLLGQRVKELLFIEFRPDEVSMVRVSLGAGGIPRQADAGSAQWSSVAAELDSRDDIRAFQLAGGIGTLPPVSRTDFDTAVLHWLKAYVPPSYEHSVVLLTPRSGWVLLERAAVTARSVFPLLAELRRGAAVPAGSSTADAVRDVLRTAPLLADHVLTLALADRDTGAVGTHHHVLFPAGSRLGRGETATAEVTVHGGLDAGAPLKLPVFAGRPQRNGPAVPLVALHEAVVGALAPARLTFVLRGPGEVELLDSRTGVPHAGHKDAAEIPELLTRLPHRILRPPPLELHLTVELSGADQAETEERLTFARDLLAALARQDPTGTSIRAGAVGHYDHAIHENSHTPRGYTVLPPVPAGPVPVALAAMAAWQPATRGQDLASSLEDALRVVPSGRSAPGGRPSEAVRRILLVVARRPPGQPRQHGIHPACPLGADWRGEVARLRAAGIRVMTRADPVTGTLPADAPGLAARHYADTAWAELGADGYFRPGHDSAAEVAHALLPSWRLEGPPCRLAFAAPLH